MWTVPNWIASSDDLPLWINISNIIILVFLIAYWGYQLFIFVLPWILTDALNSVNYRSNHQNDIGYLKKEIVNKMGVYLFFFTVIIFEQTNLNSITMTVCILHNGNVSKSVAIKQITFLFFFQPWITHQPTFLKSYHLTALNCVTLPPLELPK
jgi:hypothetical protein